MLETEQQKVGHLLRRFGFGASEAEVAYYGKGGLAGAVEKLLDYESVDEGFSVDPNSLANAKNKLKIEAVQEWWLMRMVATRRPLQEKMTLFWHNHFATSTDKVVSPYMMLAQNQILRAGATGKFADLLLSVSKDPAMLLWLDNQFNVNGHPNENFARELMELFTLGIGHYTEHDVQESARAFTGWGFGGKGKTPLKNQKNAKNTVFLDRDDLHDHGTKEFLGNKGDFDGDDMIGILCSNPRTAEFITSKLWTWFAYPNPDATLVKRLADPFFRDGLNIKNLLRSIMHSSEFYSQTAERAIYKNPIDFAVVTARQLGFGAQALTDDNFKTMVRLATALRISTKGMGMDVLWPPDVSGWKTGQAWVSTATVVERIRWAQVLFDRAEVAVKKRQFTLGVDATNLFAQDPTPEGAATRLAAIFDADLPKDRHIRLVEAAKSAMAGAADDVAAAVSRLIFAAPEFQFC